MKYDPFVVINNFVERLEVFGVFTSGYVLHTWQESETKFADKWDKLGGLFSPKFNSAPVVHQMSDDFFNGILHLFVRGEDYDLHHIKQTTCDKVQNPWGPCTWDLGFSKLGGGLPSNKSSPNPLSISRNIHLGIEVHVCLLVFTYVPDLIATSMSITQQDVRCSLQWLWLFIHVVKSTLYALDVVSIVKSLV